MSGIPNELSIREIQRFTALKKRLLIVLDTIPEEVTVGSVVEAPGPLACVSMKKFLMMSVMNTDISVDGTMLDNIAKILDDAVAADDEFGRNLRTHWMPK